MRNRLFAHEDGTVRMMQITAEQAMDGYADAYQKLYNRMPKELRALDANWVMVNGACINAEELQNLTERLEQEHAELEGSRSLLSRLASRFKS